MGWKIRSFIIVSIISWVFPMSDVQSLFFKCLTCFDGIPVFSSPGMMLDFWSEIARSNDSVVHQFDVERGI